MFYPSKAPAPSRTRTGPTHSGIQYAGTYHRSLLEEDNILPGHTLCMIILYPRYVNCLWNTLVTWPLCTALPCPGTEKNRVEWSTVEWSIQPIQIRRPLSDSPHCTQYVSDDAIRILPSVQFPLNTQAVNSSCCCCCSSPAGPITHLSFKATTVPNQRLTGSRVVTATFLVPFHCGRGELQLKWNMKSLRGEEEEDVGGGTRK